jgi:hypothetical protein
VENGALVGVPKGTGALANYRLDSVRNSLIATYISFYFRQFCVVLVSKKVFIIALFLFCYYHELIIGLGETASGPTPCCELTPHTFYGGGSSGTVIEQYNNNNSFSISNSNNSNNSVLSPVAPLTTHQQYIQISVRRHLSSGTKRWLAELRKVSVIFVNLTSPFKVPWNFFCSVVICTE